MDVAFDRNGNLLIADSGTVQLAQDFAPLGSLVRVVAASTGTFYGQSMTAGDIYTVAGQQNPPGYLASRPQGLAAAGDGGPATQAWLGIDVGSVRTDQAGNLVEVPRVTGPPQLRSRCRQRRC